MPKVAINRSAGLPGVRLSAYAVRELAHRGLASAQEILNTGAPGSLGLRRDDPQLIAILEQFGEAAWGGGCVLLVVSVPDDVDWMVVRDGDGVEWVAERHRWWPPQGPTLLDEEWKPSLKFLRTFRRGPGVPVPRDPLEHGPDASID
jgi:hypothetical protein